MKCDVEKWQKLVNIMEALRKPDGCAWDRAQTHESLKKYFLEETYEVLDAIDRKSDAALCDELGDVLLQVVFHAQLAAEEDRFTIDDVVEGVSNKMIRRHPHVFAEEHAENPEQVLTMWESIKAQEKSDAKDEKRGLMMINDNLPALMMAQKAQDKAHRVGFDWPDAEGPRQKVAEEMEELMQAHDKNAAEEEVGDLLFSVVNLARFYDVDAEQALRKSAKKFMNRFTYIEQCVNQSGAQWKDYSLEQLDEFWAQAKQQEVKN